MFRHMKENLLFDNERDWRAWRLNCIVSTISLIISLVMLISTLLVMLLLK